MNLLPLNNTNKFVFLPALGHCIDFLALTLNLIISSISHFKSMPHPLTPNNHPPHEYCALVQDLLVLKTKVIQFGGGNITYRLGLFVCTFLKLIDHKLIDKPILLFTDHVVCKSSLNHICFTKQVWFKTTTENQKDFFFCIVTIYFCLTMVSCLFSCCLFLPIIIKAGFIVFNSFCALFYQTLVSLTINK